MSDSKVYYSSVNYISFFNRLIKIPLQRFEDLTMSLCQVRSLLFAVTLISAAAPASAITHIGNAEASQTASCVCQGKIFPERLCPMIHCIDEVAFASVEQSSNITSPTTSSAVFVARDWFGWERQDRKLKA